MAKKEKIEEIIIHPGESIEERLKEIQKITADPSIESAMKGWLIALLLLISYDHKITPTKEQRRELFGILCEVFGQGFDNVLDLQLNKLGKK